MKRTFTQSHLAALAVSKAGKVKVNGRFVLLSETAKREVVLERFWAKVNKATPTECWEWNGAKNPKGYGRFGHEAKKTRVAHRWLFEELNGTIPKGRLVCHRCDNPSCVNPSHFFLGTPMQNTQDMISKGRMGPRHIQSNLTPAQVREIREQYNGKTNRQLASKYGISASNVINIGKRRTWKSIP